MADLNKEGVDRAPNRALALKEARALQLACKRHALPKRATACCKCGAQEQYPEYAKRHTIVAHFPSAKSSYIQWICRSCLATATVPNERLYGGKRRMRRRRSAASVEGK